MAKDLRYCNLQYLFNKHDMDIKEDNSLMFNLDGDLSKHTIESRGDGMGIVVIKYTDEKSEIVGSMNNYKIEQLLQLKVVLSSWNEYRWGGPEYTEEKIVKLIYADLSPHAEEIQINK